MRFLRDPFIILPTIHIGFSFTLAMIVVYGFITLSGWIAEFAIYPDLEEEYEDLLDVAESLDPAGIKRWVQRPQSDYLYIVEWQGQIIQSHPFLTPQWLEYAESDADITDQGFLEFVDDQDNAYIGYYFDVTDGYDGDETEYDLALDRMPMAMIAVKHARYDPLYVGGRVGLLLLLAGIAATGFFFIFSLNRIRARLRLIHQQCQHIIKTDSYDTRIPAGPQTGLLADTNDQLNQLLAQVDLSLQRSRQQAANIAHDLRTPLTGLFYKLQKMVPDYPDLAPHLSHLEMLLDIFQRLLQIHRLEAHARKIEAVRQPLLPILQDIAELYMPTCVEKSQTIRIAETDKMALFDRDLLMQSLLNLVDNAHKYAPADSVIALSLAENNTEVILMVQDQSGGVSPQDLPRLCDRFYRVDSSRQQTGSGLGLSFVKAAINLTGGVLELQNGMLGGKKGLTVILRLPK